ncbi:MAG TPA: S41 family peptidase, partial [Dehalococcoidia bacterium]
GDRDAVAVEYNRAADILDERGLTSLATTTRSALNEDRPVRTPRPPQTSDVTAAEQALVALYVDKPDYGDLLDAAWLGARAFAVRQGVAVPNEIAPRLIAAQAQAELNLRNALDALVRASAGKASRDDIVFEAITAMAKSLKDNHTGFVRPTSLQPSSGGSAYGFGFFGVPDGAGGAIVREVLPGSPAAKAGIHPGDLIPNGADLLEPEDLPAAPDGGLRLTVDRDAARFDVSIAPAVFDLPLLTSGLLEGNVGYVRLTSFPSHLHLMPDGRSFVQDFDATIADLQRQGATRWVLDLRGNPGGSTITGAIVAARLGYAGSVAELDMRGERVTRTSSLGPRTLAGAPLALLVDKQSASMAEVLSQTLKDAGRARIFGAQTAGKVNGAGVQPIAGGALEITLARIKAGPSFSAIDEIGVAPDFAVPLDRKQLSAGHDNQLDAALQYLLALKIR